jgi:hypothetical protein
MWRQGQVGFFGVLNEPQFSIRCLRMRLKVEHGLDLRSAEMVILRTIYEPKSIVWPEPEILEHKPVFQDILPEAQRRPRESPDQRRRRVFRYPAVERRHAVHGIPPGLQPGRERHADHPQCLGRLHRRGSAGLRRAVPPGQLPLRLGACVVAASRWWMLSVVWCMAAGFIDHNGVLGRVHP